MTNKEIAKQNTTDMYKDVMFVEKTLWHDAEEPEKGKPCLLYGVFTKDDKEPIEDYFVSYFTTYGWTEDYFPEDYDYTIKRWCYIDDLLPKGGEE